MAATNRRQWTCNCTKMSCSDQSQVDGPFYTQLGVGSSPGHLRSDIAQRAGVWQHEVRLVEVAYTPLPGVTDTGRPKTTQSGTLFRESADERILVLYKHRHLHHCAQQFVVVAIVVWEVMDQELCKRLRKCLIRSTRYMEPAERQCDGGVGASYSLGCSYQWQRGACRFIRTMQAGGEVRKFRCDNGLYESELGAHVNFLADSVSSYVRALAPEAHGNMVRRSALRMPAHSSCASRWNQCRLGRVEDRIFSGATCCLDYLALPHTDWKDVSNGCSAVLTLLKNPGSVASQLHVFPHYMLARAHRFPPFDFIRGGVGLGLTNGSLLLEVARLEPHGTTLPGRANPDDPGRASVVLYEHHGLNKPHHGHDCWGH